MHLRASYTPRRFGIAVNVHGDSSVYAPGVKHFFRFERLTSFLSEALKRFCTLFLTVGTPAALSSMAMKPAPCTLPEVGYVDDYKTLMVPLCFCNVRHLVLYAVTPVFRLTRGLGDGVRQLQIRHSHFSKNMQI